jgi:phage shock protein B
MGVDVIAVLMVFGIPLVAIVGGLGLEALKIIKGTPKKGKEVSAEETELMQDLFRTAAHMEKRIEALETLLLDRAREAAKEERFR